MESFIYIYTYISVGHFKFTFEQDPNVYEHVYICLEKRESII